MVEPPWITLVWDDPVNLMSYVTFVFVEYFHYSKAKAQKLMMQVHTEGKAVVATGSREEIGARRAGHACLRVVGHAAEE